MERYHRDAELAPRDVVARAIDHEMKVHGFEHVYLDITHQAGELDRGALPEHRATVPRARHRSDARVDARRAGRPLPLRRRRDRPRRSDVDPTSVRVRRGRDDGPPRCQPSGVQLAPRRPRLRAPCGLARAGSSSRRPDGPADASRVEHRYGGEQRRVRRRRPELGRGPAHDVELRRHRTLDAPAGAGARSGSRCCRTRSASTTGTSW